jgi:hypothetical protein
MSGQCVMRALALGLLLALPSLSFAAAEPNTQVPRAAATTQRRGTGPHRRLAGGRSQPRVRRGLAYRWQRAGAAAGDRAGRRFAGHRGHPPGACDDRALQTENGLSHHHRADIGGLQPDTQYVYRVQGNGSWSAWNQLRTLAARRPAADPAVLR